MYKVKCKSCSFVYIGESKRSWNSRGLALEANIGTLSVQELFFQLIGWLGVELGVSPVGMVYFIG